MNKKSLVCVYRRPGFFMPQKPPPVSIYPRHCEGIYARGNPYSPYRVARRRQYRSADCHGSCDPRNDAGSLTRCACAQILCKTHILPRGRATPQGGFSCPAGNSPPARPYDFRPTWYGARFGRRAFPTHKKSRSFAAGKLPGKKNRGKIIAAPRALWPSGLPDGMKKLPAEKLGREIFSERY